MSEYTALEKHACVACGAQAEWHPEKQQLVCPYCHTVSPFEVDKSSGEIREIPLVATLREMSDDLRGWQAEKRTVRCQSCNAVSVFDPERVGQNCGFCGSPALVDYEEIKAPIRPESLLQFKVSQTQVRDDIRKWYASKWFAPGKLKSKALVDTVKGVYLPYWTFDAEADCPWTADSGYYYYTTESYRDSNGQMKTRQVRHTRWQPSAGRVQHFFDDQPIPATRGVNSRLLPQIEPFPTHELVPYDTAYLSGFVVEHYQVVLIEAAQESRKRMEQSLYQMCAGEVPGDTHRNLQISPTFSAQTFKHILAPVWLLTYNYGTRAYQVLVNGYTGKIAGEYPKSFWKILFLVLAILLVVTVFILLSE